jgi:threonylcarbamoyladenosine tRNA methylthiotransferase MtaB
MITTDILVGFPTEDEERFQSSVKVCEHVQYLKAHVFRFSPRFGTPADQWGDPVDPQTKAARSKRLVEVTTASAQNQMKRFLGRTMRVLVERRSKKDGLLQGTTDNWLSVKFAGPPEFARTMQWVRLDELQGGTLIGELASEPARPQLQVV